MRLSPRLFRALGWCAATIGAAAAPFILFAVLEGAAGAARGFFLTAAGGGFLGGVILSGTNRVSRPAGASSALRLALYGWMLGPILAAPPLVIGLQSLPAGLFEAYSALTTTGAIIGAPESLPRSLVLWRCVLGWMGGLASLVLAATVFAALDRRGVGLRRTSLLTVERSDLFTNFGRAVRRLGAVYAGVTLAGVVLLMMGGAAPFDALCLALSGVSTSGLSPQSGALSGWLSPVAIGVLAVLCASGAWNMAVQYELATRLRSHRGTGELRAMIILSLVCGIAVLVAYGPGAAASGALDGFFAVTTAGFRVDAQMALPSVAALFLALVGGATISTSGGMKMPRVLLLLRRAGGELSTLSHPSAAVRTRFAGRTVSDEALAGVWVYALAFPTALAFGAVAVGLGGAGFDQAWSVAAASLANAGPLAGVDYALLAPASLLASGALMVLGRLEVLAAAAAIYVIFARD